MARRDLTGAVDFAHLQTFAGDDADLMAEVFSLFREQARVWGPMLDPAQEGWRDAAHAVKGMARGVGAFALGDACEAAEVGTAPVAAARTELDRALADLAAFEHEQALRSLKG